MEEKNPVHTRALKAEAFPLTTETGSRPCSKGLFHQIPVWTIQRDTENGTLDTIQDSFRTGH